jgi:hypothetical protein
MNNRKLLFLINGPIWLALFAYIILNGFYQLYFNDIGGMTAQALKMNIGHSINMLLCLLLSFYAFYSYLVPRFLFKGKKLHFWLLSIIYIIIVGPIIPDLIDSLLGYFLDMEVGMLLILIKHPSHVELKTVILGILFWSIIVSICGIFGYIFKLAFNSFKNEQLKKELEIKNHLSEIKVLKSKLNPHFLFNTINNIDTLIQSRPILASEALSKLSDILRYMVYETENEQIPIKTEIENLEKYIDLEKMRLVNPDTASYTCTIKSDFSVPPLIFFPFVENGFKHSNLNSSNQKLRISMSEENNSLLFKCINTVYERKQEPNFKGVGLELAKKRLDLLYPKRHELSIKKENNEFHVSLQIDLNL